MAPTTAQEEASCYLLHVGAASNDNATGPRLIEENQQVMLIFDENYCYARAYHILRSIILRSMKKRRQTKREDREQEQEQHTTHTTDRQNRLRKNAR